MANMVLEEWDRVTQLDETAQIAITDFLYETDIVKFANVTPSSDEIDTITRQARGLISLTQIQEIVVDSGASTEEYSPEMSQNEDVQ